MVQSNRNLLLTFTHNGLQASVHFIDLSYYYGYGT